MNKPKTNYKFIGFKEINKSDKWICYNIKANTTLGLVEYYLPWDQYIIEFEQGTIFNNQCLKDIANFLTQINKKYKEPELSL